jgi:ATP-dependent DNA ligase|tara:strand:+ start:218 stop:967 length:750 start_codon:yes stop_codon:yes gene_type:complete
VYSETNASLRCITRTGTDIASKLCKIGHIWNTLAGLPTQTIVDAELYAEGVQATDIKTLINDRDKRLQLSGFALPYLRGELVETMHAAMSLLEGLYCNPPEILEDYGDAELLDADEIQHWLQVAIDRRMEGFVLKEDHLKGWWKLKPTKTVDVVVTDTTTSWSATHFGGIQGFNIVLYDQENGYEKVPMGNVGSGFPAELRDRHPSNFIGRVMEVKYDSLAAKGKLKFPRFVCWRDDKPKEECTLDQLK